MPLFVLSLCHLFVTFSNSNNKLKENENNEIVGTIGTIWDDWTIGEEVKECFYKNLFYFVYFKKFQYKTLCLCLDRPNRPRSSQSINKLKENEKNNPFHLIN